MGQAERSGLGLLGSSGDLLAGGWFSSLLTLPGAARWRSRPPLLSSGEQFWPFPSEVAEQGSGGCECASSPEKVLSQ